MMMLLKGSSSLWARGGARRRHPYRAHLGWARPSCTAPRQLAPALRRRWCFLLHYRRVVGPNLSGFTSRHLARTLSLPPPPAPPPSALVPLYLPAPCTLNRLPLPMSRHTGVRGAHVASRCGRSPPPLRGARCCSWAAAGQFANKPLRKSKTESYSMCLGSFTKPDTEPWDLVQPRLFAKLTQDFSQFASTFQCALWNLLLIFKV